MINNKTKKFTSTFMFYFFGTLVALVILIPFFWMVSTSLKSRGALIAIPIEWIPKKPNINSFKKIFGLSEFNGALLNSLYLAVTTSTIQIISAAMAAYAFSKIKFRGRESLFKVYLATMMIPFQVIFIPLFIIMSTFRLTNNLNAFLLLQFFNPFAIFMLRQKMMTISDSYIEAAVIDGAKSFQIFGRIILPLSRGILATLFVISFMGSWNDYLFPLVMLSDKKKFTLPLILNALETQYGREYNTLMAGSLVSIIPILIIYIFAQKQFQSGLQVGGIKG